mgnify:CR=1 FL=1
MSLTRVVFGLFEFLISLVITVLVVYLSYTIFSRANPDYDEEDELNKGNVAVAILLTAIMVSSAIIIQKGLFPIMTLLRMYFTSPMKESIGQWQMMGYALAHFVMVFALSVFSISLALRLFGKLTRKIKEGRELKKGNVAVGIVLAGVVLIVSAYVGDSINSLAKSLIPEPSIGKIRILK